MATSKTKKTRKSQYEEIVGDLQKVRIIGFRFSSLSDAYNFHFQLMESKLPYLLFDAGTEKVKIILSKDCDVNSYTMIGETCNGTFYQPVPYNDYE